MNLTQKAMLGVSAVAMATALAGCGQTTTYPRTVPPTDSQCRDWEWDSKNGVYRCDDSSSSYYRNYYYGNSYYSSRSALQKSSSYSAYKSSITSKTSSGFGKGSSIGGG
ncbi:aminotransferase yhxA [Paenibacillus sp. ATY16]|uniref:aminotransferase yhxA n=1 Tax=Paenibacillus sp. ATY16 TaxID=1759312 RepID=UPI002010387F|nr:aminotransferase yhxA [Paenibacillus sp. ATY16]MCK9857191.1 aminotransferase yhxA [Paenibacillus sp. ATY16]